MPFTGLHLAHSQRTSNSDTSRTHQDGQLRIVESGISSDVGFRVGRLHNSDMGSQRQSAQKFSVDFLEQQFEQQQHLERYGVLVRAGEED